MGISKYNVNSMNMKPISQFESLHTGPASFRTSRHGFRTRQLVISSHRKLDDAKDCLKTTNKCHIDKKDEESPDLRSRRECILKTLSVVSIVSFGSCYSSQAQIELPEDYVKTAHGLIDSLRDSIEADLSGLPEREVRRKAEPAKDFVKKFISIWSDAAVLKDEDSCQEIRVAVQELGDFYRMNGQRNRLNQDVADSILSHLEKAEMALPELPAKKNIFPF